MKKIFFNDRYGLTKAVLEGRKTMTRRLVPEGTPFGNWEETLQKSRYQLGEVVAVAQKYSEIYDHNFAFDFGLDLEPGWKNKMFVSAAECKHQIRITNVRVERLQDITEGGCKKEGIQYCPTKASGLVDCSGKYPLRDCGDCFFTPRKAFAALIDKVSGKGTWERNPWVFVYEFELIK